MQYTSKLKLKKPDYTDVADIADINENMDILDEEISELKSHAGSTSNPHKVTKAQVGLGNVDNTSDANKPISTAMQTALNGKADDDHTHTLDEISETTDKKIMTAAERSKLSGIATGANKTTVDASLSSTSTNPVQNKAVKAELDKKAAKTEIPTSLKNPNALTVKVGSTTTTYDGSAAKSVNIVIDDTPTEDSNNLITSGGVYDFVKSRNCYYVASSDSSERDKAMADVIIPVGSDASTYLNAITDNRTSPYIVTATYSKLYICTGTYTINKPWYINVSDMFIEGEGFNTKITMNNGSNIQFGLPSSSLINRRVQNTKLNNLFLISNSSLSTISFGNNASCYCLNVYLDSLILQRNYDALLLSFSVFTRKTYVKNCIFYDAFDDEAVTGQLAVSILNKYSLILRGNSRVRSFDFSQNAVYSDIFLYYNGTSEEGSIENLIGDNIICLEHQDYTIKQ